MSDRIEIVRQKDGERIVADERACAPDGVPQTERHLLTHGYERAGLHLRALQRRQRIRLVTFAQRSLEFKGDVEMLYKCGLAAAGHHAELLDACGPCFLDRVLNQRLVYNGQHFLRRGLCGRQEPCSQSGNRQDRFSQFFHPIVAFIKVTAAMWRGAASGIRTFSSIPAATAGVAGRGAAQLRPKPGTCPTTPATARPGAR